MEKFTDFSFDAEFGGRWSVKYTGKQKKIDIPKELVAQAKNDAFISFSTETDGIEIINIPENVTDVWFGTFYKDENLKQINVSGFSPYLMSKDGVLFSKDGSRLIKAPAQMYGEYTVPDGVKTIVAFAFENSCLKKINLPDSLEKIGAYAFKGCKNLEETAVPAGVEKINSNVFSYDPKLENFEFKGKTVVEYKIKETEQIANDLEEAISKEIMAVSAEGYLLGCIKNFEELEKYRQRFIAAAKRGNRQKIYDYLVSTKPAKTIEKPVFEINDGVLVKYTGEEETVKISAETDGKKVSSIGKEAFKGNEYLQKVVIGEGIEKIGECAFEGCIALEEAVLPESCKEIERAAFNGCKSLKNINIPKCITDLNSKVFKDCGCIEKLSLPEGLKEIGFEALKNCEKLDCMVLPEGISTLGKEALYNCGFNHGEEHKNSWGYGVSEFYMPESITKISDGGQGQFACYAADRNKADSYEYKIKLKVKKGSEAHKYALKNKIRCELI